MTAPRAREQRRPPSPPDTLPPRRGGGSSPYINAVCSAGRPADLGCLRGLVRSARALAAAACLSLVCGLALPASAQAQEVTLVSNIGEARSSWGAANPENYTGGSESRVAQQFTTGPSTGYSLQSVLLDLSASAGPGARVRVGIHRNNNLGNPGRQLVVLDTPAAPFGTNVRFPAATPLSLDADTSYWVVVSNTGHRNSQVFVSVTSSAQQTTTQEFEIADSRKAGKPGYLDGRCGHARQNEDPRHGPGGEEPDAQRAVAGLGGKPHPDFRLGHAELLGVGAQQRPRGDVDADEGRSQRDDRVSGRVRQDAPGRGHQHGRPPGGAGRGRDHFHGEGDGRGRHHDADLHRDRDAGRRVGHRPGLVHDHDGGRHSGGARLRRDRHARHARDREARRRQFRLRVHPGGHLSL